MERTSQENTMNQKMSDIPGYAQPPISQDFIDAVNKGMEEPLAPVMVEDTRIKAFNPDDDELAGVTREELLKELGKDSVDVEEVQGKVVIDEITGETSMSTPIEEDQEANILDSLQALNNSGIVDQMTSLARTQIKFMLPFNYTEDQLTEFIDNLEEKLRGISAVDIDHMTTDSMRAFIGDEVYDHMKSMQKHPCAALKAALIEIKNTMAQKAECIDVMKDMEVAMEFFKKKPLADIHDMIKKQLDAEADKYPTEFHRFREYLKRYIDQLKEGENNTFVNNEIEISNEKISAIDDALSFATILKSLANLKNDIAATYKDVKKTDSTILNFIGFMNADTTMNIQFPVPKGFATAGSADATINLCAVWLLFLELIILYKQFPDIYDLSNAEYYDMETLLLSDKTDELTERETELLEISKKHNITKKDILNARGIGTFVTYVLARVFKPKNLTKHKKYVLSYTMSILSHAKNKAYLSIAHQLCDAICDAFMDDANTPTDDK